MKKSVLFACLEEEAAPENTEIQGNEVNSPRRHINLAIAMGGAGEERIGGVGRSSIIDTCFNGGRLCSFSWVNRYVEYLESLRLKTKLYKKGDVPVKFVFWKLARTGVLNGDGFTNMDYRFI